MSHLSPRHWITLLGFAVILVAAPVMASQSVFAADSCAAPATNYGTDTMSATIPVTGTYTIWTHMKIPSTSANSVLLNVGGTCYNVGGSTSIPANTWTWIKYYDGNTANVVSQSLTQGAKSVELIGTAANVLVDQVEFILGTCTPTGNGSNCVVTTTTTTPTGGGGGGTTTTTTTTSTGGSGKGTVSVVKSGGTLTPSDTSVPTQVTAPFTVQPAPATSGDPIKEVQYYLNGKLLATVTTTPYSYEVDTKKILNGTYTLVTKTTYQSGKTATTSQKLIVKNPASFEQFMLAARHYIVAEIIILIILIIGIRLLRRWLQSRRPPTDGMLPPPTDGSGGGEAYAYTPLQYGGSSNPPTTVTPEVPGATPPSLPQLPVPPAGGQPGVGDNNGNGSNNGPLPYQ